MKIMGGHIAKNSGKPVSISELGMNRRSFLFGAASVAVAASVPLPASARVVADGSVIRGEHFVAPYFSGIKDVAFIDCTWEGSFTMHKCRNIRIENCRVTNVPDGDSSIVMTEASDFLEWPSVRLGDHL